MDQWYQDNNCIQESKYQWHSNLSHFLCQTKQAKNRADHIIEEVAEGAIQVGQAQPSMKLPEPTETIILD